MKLLKIILWTLWFVGWVEIIAVNIYLHNIYPQEFNQAVKKECEQLNAERQDYSDAYDYLADRLNECNKQFVIRSEMANRDKIDIDPNDTPDPTDPNQLDNNGCIELRE